MTIEMTSIFTFGAGVQSGVMAAAGTIRSDAMVMDVSSEAVALEIIWTGNPAGQFFCQGQLGDYPWEPIDLDGLENPVGVAYAGLLTAANLDAADIGRCIVEIPDMSYTRIRVGYTNIAGAGTCRIRLANKCAPRHLGGEAGWRTTIDACEYHASWTALNVASTNKANSINHIWGLGSISIGKAADAAIVEAGCQKTLVQGVNLRRHGPMASIRFSIYIPLLTDVLYAFLRLGTDATNLLEWRVPPAKLTTGWNTVELLVGAPSTYLNNGWDPSNVTYVAWGLEFGLPATVLAGILMDNISVVNSEAPIIIPGMGAIGMQNYLGQERIVGTGASAAATLPLGTNAFLITAEGSDVRYRVNGVVTATDGGLVPVTAGRFIRADNIASLTTWATAATGFANLVYFKKV